MIDPREHGRLALPHSTPEDAIERLGPRKEARPLSKSLGTSLAAAILTAAVVLTGLPPTAQGQTPDTQPPGGAARAPGQKVEEIVVRGTTQGSMDFTAADSVTSFNAADLQALGAQSIEDLAAFTPNLEIVSSGATTPSFFIRGVGLNDFNANAVSSVAIYQDDVNLSGQGLQLPTIFDVEAVNVLRGPQGTGLARNASAGAIKLYSRKPTGQFNGFGIATAGNYNYQDYQGGVEAPIWKDILSARLAFRYIDRDGFVENGCGGLAAERIGFVRPFVGIPIARCRATEIRGVPPISPGGTGLNIFSSSAPNVPAGLPDEANDRHVYALRSTFRFEPGLDSSFLAGVQYAKLHERSRLGHAYGTSGQAFGSTDILGYKKPEVALMQLKRFHEVADCDITVSACVNRLQPIAIELNESDLAKNLDDEPYIGYYDRVGPTRNEVLSTYIRGEYYLPYGIDLRTVTGYATYDRLIDVDLDFSPTVLAEVAQDDDLYQLTQDLAFSGDLGDFDPATWEFGGLFLYEDLNALQDITLRQDTAAFLISGRKYSQQIRSWAVYGQFERDLWNDFVIDGGVRWNWEQKELRMMTLSGLNNGPERAQRRPAYFNPDEAWNAPTGTLRLTYNFTEDARSYWKYTRGWKAGHYNATSPPRIDGVSVADPETIDAFETGFLASWFGGMLDADFSLFYYAYSNYQLFTIETDFGTLPAFVVLNVDNAEVYGAELDLVAKPWPGAFWNVRGSWLESHFVDFVQQQVEQRTIGDTVVTVVREVDATGNRLLNSPQFKVSFSLEQAIPLWKYGAIIPRYDGVWTSENFFDVTEGRGIPRGDGTFRVPKHTFSQKDYWMHNARLSYAPPTQNPVVSVWVRNIEDKAVRQLGADATTFLSTTLHYVGDPRTYGVDVVFTF